MNTNINTIEWILTFAIGIACGIGSALSLQVLAIPGAVQNEELHRHTTEHVSSSEHVHAILGGAQNLIEVQRDNRREIPELETIEFHIQNNFDNKPAYIRYTAELVSEFGEEIIQPYASPEERLEPGVINTYDLYAHIGLPNGFYLYRITVVGRAGDDFADSVLEVGIAIVDGTVHLLSDEEWLTYSYANHAHGAQQ